MKPTKKFSTSAHALNWCERTNRLIWISAKFLDQVLPLHIELQHQTANFLSPYLWGKFGPCSTNAPITVQPHGPGEDQLKLAIEVASLARGWGYRVELIEKPLINGVPAPSTPSSSAAAPPAKKAEKKTRQPAADPVSDKKGSAKRKAVR